jgi:hypothetical protein
MSRRGGMTRSRAAAVVTWAYAGMFGVPAVPVAVFVAKKGRLPSLWGLFDMYAGPWSSRFADDRVIVLLVVYSGVVLAAVVSGWLLWRMRRAGAVLNLGLLPVEAAFWLGFALPVPWLCGIGRVALVCLAWRELSGSRRQAPAATLLGNGMTRIGRRSPRGQSGPTSEDTRRSTVPRAGRQA